MVATKRKSLAQTSRDEARARNRAKSRRQNSVHLVCFAMHPLIVLTSLTTPHPGMFIRGVTAGVHPGRKIRRTGQHSTVYKGCSLVGRSSGLAVVRMQFQ